MRAIKFLSEKHFFQPVNSNNIIINKNTQLWHKTL